MSGTVSLDTVRLERREGTSFVVTIAEAGPQSATSAPVVLIVPAMGMRADYYTSMITAFAAAGIPAAVTELRGHELDGGRRPSHRYDYGYAELVDDTARAVAVLRARFPGSPVIALGHSLGGHIGLALAASRPGSLDAVVLAASSTPHWKSWGPKLVLGGALIPVISHLIGHYPGSVLGFAGRESKGQMTDWSGLALTGRFPVADTELATLDVPVLAISVEGDDFATKRAVNALTARLGSATVTREHLDVDSMTHFTVMRSGDVVVPLVAGWFEAAMVGRGA